MCVSASQLNLRAEVRARASWLESGTSNSTRFHCTIYTPPSARGPRHRAPYFRSRSDLGPHDG
eukprot:6065998-Prymnesium_polylepis.1